MQACAKLASIFSVVYVTVPSKEVGKSIAREVIQSKLAACVNIVPTVTSVYEWEGKLQEDEESLLIIKTKTDHLEKLKEAILEKHPYDVPEFVSVPIEFGSSPYLKWVQEQLTASSPPSAE
ncbi:putativeprotein [Aphelenchoides fujianensis]|nr:putativeprotein [Aphelenchoides fujianensis]